MQVKASHFFDRDGRCVLTDEGKPGRDGQEASGSRLHCSGL